MTVKESRFIAKTFLKEYCLIYDHIPAFLPLSVAPLAEAIRSRPWAFESLIDSMIMYVINNALEDVRRFEILQEIRNITADPHFTVAFYTGDGFYNTVTEYVNAQIENRKNKEED